MVEIYKKYILLWAAFLLFGCQSETNAPAQKQTSAKTPNSQNQQVNEDDQVDAGRVEYFLSLMKTITERSDEIEKEKERNNALRLELLGLGAVDSCMLDMPVEKVEFYIDGDKLEMLDVSSELGKTSGLIQPKMDGSDTLEFKFVLGSKNKKLSFVNDEIKEKVFVKGRNKAFPVEQTGFTIKDLEYIKIMKPNHYHQKDYVCQGLTEQQCNTQYQGHVYRVLEHHRYAMYKFRVKINGELIYQNDQTSFAFAKHFEKNEGVTSKGLEWYEPNLMSNEAFLKLMQIKNCNF